MTGAREVQRPRVLFVAPVEPWSRENGSSLITADVLEGLEQVDLADILPIFVRKPPAGYERHAPKTLEGELLDIPGLPRWLSIVGATLRGSTPLRMRFDNGRVARATAEVVRRRRFAPDLVHVEHLPLVNIGLKLARRYGAPLVYRAHNIESQLWKRRLGRAGPVGRAFIRRMEREEAAASREADLTLCISEDDLAWVRRSAPEARAELFPSPLLIERYEEIARQAPSSEPQICFVGGLDWAPNEAGLHWFVHEVLPLILERSPETQVAVLARGADKRPWVHDHPSVRLVRPETSAGSLFSSSSVSVAPLLQGGGVRIKIPESLALGCPVVATPIGAEGHQLPGLTATDDPSSFAEACVRHVANPLDDDERSSLRQAVAAIHGARSLAERLVHLWNDTIARPGKDPSPFGSSTSRTHNPHRS